MPDQQEKKWYASKTLWVNLLSVIALVVQTQTEFIVDAEAQVALLGVINLVLRAVTKSHLNWK
jgi:low temperature requirement protein LtrA